MKMSTLKVNGLTYRTVEREVEKLFDRYGKINEVFIPKDRYSRRSRGFAFVRFVDKLDAETAKEDMQGRQFDGREIKIEWSKKDANGERRRSATRSRSRDRKRRRSRSPRRRSRSPKRRSRSPRRRSPSPRRSRSRDNRRREERRRSPDGKGDHSRSDRGRERRGSEETARRGNIGCKLSLTFFI